MMESKEEGMAPLCSRDRSKEEEEKEGMAPLCLPDRSKGEEEKEDLTVQETMNILNALSREELIDFVQEAASEHRYVRDKVLSFAVKKIPLRKLFVRGLGCETNEQSLAAVFSCYGELNGSRVIRDKTSGRSKGYGFVTFKHVNGAIKALKERSKIVDGRIAVCQFAPTGLYPSQPQPDLDGRTIYVGDVPIGMEADALVSLFSQYGEIEEGPKGFNKNRGRSSGYAFFIFKTVEAANRALQEPIKITDDGHELYCKVANENCVNSPPPYTANANGFHIPYHFGLIPANPALQFNQGSNPWPLTPWTEPLFNPNHAIDNNYSNGNPVFFNTYQYGFPNYAGYPPEGSGYYTHGVQASPYATQSLLTELDYVGYPPQGSGYYTHGVQASPYTREWPLTEGSGYTRGVQASSATTTQSLSTDFTFAEEGSHPGSSTESQYQNQPHGVQTSTGTPQSLLTEFTEEPSRPGSSNQSQYQNQQRD